MSNKLKLLIMIFIFALFYIIFSLLRKKKIPVKYSLLWFLSLIILLLVALFPGFMGFISKNLGFEVLSNMLIFILIGLLILITITLTVIVSNQKEQIKLLIQEISMLKGDKK